MSSPGLAIGATLLGQAVLTLALAGGLWILQGQVAALSALLGGLAALVPNAFLGGRLLRTGSDGKQVLRAAWIGELGKLGLTAAIFAVIFARVRPLAPLAVFGGFIAAQLVVLGALLLGGGAGNGHRTKS